MLQHTETLTENTVRDVENAKMNRPFANPATNASVRNTAGNSSRTLTEHDEPTTNEIYGTIANVVTMKLTPLAKA
jgi:hypothetical protein